MVSLPPNNEVVIELSSDEDDSVLLSQSVSPPSEKVAEGVGFDQKPPASGTEQAIDSGIPLAELQTKCWCCHISFVGDAVHTTTANAVSWHPIMHLHPLWNIPVCIACREDVEEVLDRDESEGDQICAGCAGRLGVSDTLFVCDRGGCPRGFCRPCLLQCNGGDEQAADEGLAEGETWSCPVCSPPGPLQQLQGSVSSPKDFRNEELQERDHEQVIIELQEAEIAKADCEKTMEDEEEWQEALPDAENGEPNPMRELQDKLRCIEDSISTLHDELTAMGVDLRFVYSEVLKMLENEVVDSDDDDAEDDPNVRSATREIDRRRKDDKKNGVNFWAVNILPRECYKQEDYTEVDELEAIDDIEEAVKRTEELTRLPQHNPKLGVCGEVPRPEADELEEALLAEQEKLSHVQRFDDGEDAAEIQEDATALVYQTAIGSGRKLVVRKSPKANDNSRARKPRHTVCPARLVPTRSKHESSTPAASKRESLLQSPARHESSHRSDPSSSTVSTPVHQTNRFSTTSAEQDGEDQQNQCHVSTTRIARFGESDLYLCNTGVRKVTVSKKLAVVLKDHQAAGVKFIWKNCFTDFETTEDGDESQAGVGGCLLAHNMVRVLHESADMRFIATFFSRTPDRVWGKHSQQLQRYIQ